MTKFFDAFISYGRADSKDFARKLQASLHEQGLKVWFDFNDIPLAVDFQKQIDDGIEKACHFLFIIAPHSVNSDYCRKEIELAIKLNKRIIPLLHVMQISHETWQQRNPNGTEAHWEAYKAKGLHDSYQNMHPTIRQFNWVQPFQENKDDFEKSLADLVKLLRSHDDYVKQHTRFLAKALEWERHQKQTNYLLVGEEKHQAQSWLQMRFQDEQPPCIPTDLHCEYITESIKNGNNLMTQVFLSYSNEDRAMMEKIRRSLRRESITVWTNTTDIQTGEGFKEAIRRGIEQADNVVYLLSPDSIKSTYCQQELDLAVSLNKRIIPLLMRKTDPIQVPSVLQDLQYIDLTDNLEEDHYQLDESQLLKILHQDAAYYNEHKILLTKALNWKQQQNNPSILLRGYNLRSAETWLKVAQKRTQHPPIPLQEEFITESLQQPPLESLDVFISYSRADSDLARKLNESLQIQGKTTWFDQESIASGSDFLQEIYRGIKTCDNFLFILSERSLKSPYCNDEVVYASSLNKRFVTVRHREVNTADLHPELAKVQWIDFNENEKDFNANFNQLVRTLDTDREHVHSHSKWLQRALEWEQKEKNDDLLLRGSEFLIAQNWLEKTEQQKKKPAATSLQKTFIEVSKNAIEAAKEEKRRQAEVLRLEEERAKEAEARLAEQKKNAKRQNLFLVAISMALVAAIVSTVVASKQTRLAEKAQEDQLDSMSQFSSTLSKQNLKFDAMIEAIKAQNQIQKLKERNPKTQSSILTALQAAVYGNGFREQNSLTKHTSTVFSASFSPDGKIIATASGDGTIQLSSLDGHIIRTIKVGNDSTNVTSVNFSPDGNTIASGDEDNTVKLWKLNGQPLQTLKGHKDAVRSVVWSPDGNTIASASDDKTVILWSKKGEIRQILTGHEDAVTSISFSPDGKIIATASKDRTIKLWSFNGREFKILPSFKCCNESYYGVTSVSFSPDGKTIASGDEENSVKLWKLNGQLRQTLKGHKDTVRSVVWSPDGNTIASASDDKTVILWDKEGEIRQILAGHEASIQSVNFSRDGKTIATTSNDNTVKLWSKSGKRLQIPTGDKAFVTSVAWSPDINTIAFAPLLDNTITVWKKNGKLSKIPTGDKAFVMSIAWSPDGNTIAFASDDKTFKLWNGKLSKIPTGDKAFVTSIAWSPDGNTIAFLSDDKTVKLWDWKKDKDWKQLQILKQDKALVTSIAWSPNGNTIAFASDDKTVKLWDWKNDKDGKQLQILQGHTSDITSVSFSRDGNMLASASNDNTVQLWSKENNFQKPKILRGHKSGVLSVTFSPDGKTLASGSEDNTVILWKNDGTQLQSMIGHDQKVTRVSFSPDGKTLASASNDDTVILWNLADLQLDKLMKNACTQVGDYLKYNAPKGDRDLCKNI